jgi:hypothetical protein
MSASNHRLTLMGFQMMRRVEQLGAIGVQVLEVRADQDKALIIVAPSSSLVPVREENGYSVVQEGQIRIAWRTRETRSSGDD